MPWIVRLLLFVTLILLLEFYFLKKFSSAFKNLYPGSNVLKFKKIILVLLGFINFVPLFFLISWLSELITGFEINLPEKSTLFDILFIYPFWFGILIILQVSVLLLPIDIIRLMIYPFVKKHLAKLRKINARIVLTISLLALIYVPGRILYDMYTVEQRNTEYSVTGLHPDLAGLKIGLISDIQADWYNGVERVTKYINKLNEFNPDLVFITGDMITHDKEYIPLVAESVGKIKSKYGVFACVGDHDNWAYDNIYKSRSEVVKSLKSVNIDMLDNKNIVIRINGAKIGITALTDVYSERIRPSVLDSLTSTLRDVDLKILLTHQPNDRLLEKAQEYNYNLMFSGHTHGGQVTILFPFINITPTLIETNYVKGDFHFGVLMMIVNRGLGMSIAPVRYNSTPEVTLLLIENQK